MSSSDGLEERRCDVPVEVTAIVRLEEMSMVREGQADFAVPPFVRVLRAIEPLRLEAKSPISRPGVWEGLVQLLLWKVKIGGDDVEARSIRAEVGEDGTDGVSEFVMVAAKTCWERR